MTGNPGKRPLNKKEPQPRGELKRPPQFTGKIGDEWDRVVNAMPPGTYTEADVPVLTIYCEALVMRHNALAIVAKPAETGGGMVVTGSAGQAAAHPMIAVASKQAEILLKCAALLGMSPVARTRLTAPDDEEKDELEQRYFGS